MSTASQAIIYTSMYKETEAMVTSACYRAYIQLIPIDRAIIDDLCEQIVRKIKKRRPDVPFSHTMALELLLALYSFRVYNRSAVMEAFARKVETSEVEALGPVDLESKDFKRRVRAKGIAVAVTELQDMVAESVG